MALQRTSTARPNRSLAIELGVVTAALTGVYLWWRATLVVTDPLTAALDPSPVTMPLGGLATAGLFVAGVVTFAWTYATARDFDVGLSLPTRADVRPIGLAVFTPVALVLGTKLVGALTGVPYDTLARTHYSAESPVLPIVVLVVLGLVVSVPSLVVICHVLVQRGLERAIDGGSDRVVVLTALVGGFAMTSTTGGLATVPELGKLVGAATFVLALRGALYLTERVADERLRNLAYVPVLLFVSIVVVSAAAGVDSLAGGVYALSPAAVIGVAAYVYDRSGSLLVPALAYLSASLAESVVLVLEAGVLP